MKNASPYRIAVVEDDPALLELLQEELTSHGYQVAACDSAEALLAQFASLSRAAAAAPARLSCRHTACPACAATCASCWRSPDRSRW